MFARGMFVLGLSVACLPGWAAAGEWPQFRGPNGSATSTEKHLPAEWGADKNIAWKAKLPGYGWSSPIAWGDKVFVTTAVTDKQTKPGGFGGFGGGRGGRGGRGGFTPPQPGQILSSFLQERLKLTDKQKKPLGELQKDVDDKLAKLFTDDQKKQLKERRGGRGGFGRGGFGGFPLPGQILANNLQEQLKLTDKQKKQLAELQKDVDGKLAKLLSADQNKQLKQMREAFANFGRGGRGGRGGGGFGNRKPPDVTYKWEIYCLNAADGKVLWKKTAAQQKPTIPTQASNTYASETPVTDGKHIYAYFGMTGVFCYDFGGKLVWKKNLGSYPMAMGWGTGSSPALDGKRLFIQCDNEEKSFLVALDKKTGDELWRTKRTERSGWSTPLVWKNKVRTEVVCLGSPRVRSYDPATGKQLWELSGMRGWCQASPAAAGDLLYVGTGYMGGMGGGFGGGRGGRGSAEGGMAGSKPLYAVKPGASGDITLQKDATSNDGVAWYLPQAGPALASPLVYEGLLYIPDQRGGLLSCYDAKTGKKVYKERLTGARGFTSSPWAYEGKVFCLDDGGQTFVVKAGRTFKLLGKNPTGEMCWSTPAVADGELFLRTVDRLYCIKKNGEAK